MHYEKVYCSGAYSSFGSRSKSLAGSVEEVSASPNFCLRLSMPLMYRTGPFSCDFFWYRHSFSDPSWMQMWSRFAVNDTHDAKKSFVAAEFGTMVRSWTRPFRPFGDPIVECVRHELTGFTSWCCNRGSHLNQISWSQYKLTSFASQTLTTSREIASSDHSSRRRTYSVKVFNHSWFGSSPSIRVYTLRRTLHTEASVRYGFSRLNWLSRR